MVSLLEGNVWVVIYDAKYIIDMDKMISIKGLVIRTTPVIPDMKTGKEN